jgi:CRP-like cAMP-binding protein
MRENPPGDAAHHPFVVDFESRHVERLSELARDARFDRGHVIFREGDECSEFYLIVSGLVALEIVAPGHLFRVQTLFAGDELGWSALLGLERQAVPGARARADRGAGFRVRRPFSGVPGRSRVRVRADAPPARRRRRAPAGDAGAALDSYSPVAARAGA